MTKDKVLLTRRIEALEIARDKALQAAINSDNEQSWLALASRHEECIIKYKAELNQ